MNLDITLALVLFLALVLTLTLTLTLTLALALTLTLTLALTLALALTLILALTLTITLTLTLALTLTLTLALTLTLTITLTLTLALTLTLTLTLNFNTKVLTRNCNKGNYIKPLIDFDESKYTYRNCPSAKVICLYCPSVVRSDGIRAQVRKQHPDVELTRGFSRNLTERSADPRSTKLPLRGSVELVPRSVITQTGESCSCKYYKLVSFFINNGTNIEKVKENINFLKSIDNLK